MNYNDAYTASHALKDNINKIFTFDNDFRKIEEIKTEIRVDIKDRIIFTFEKDIVGFVIVGNHDEIKRFLKNKSVCDLQIL
ncbi:PIN domain-containing protein [bacterium]|nr:PIN domain-containing protein [bacterium]